MKKLDKLIADAERERDYDKSRSMWLAVFSALGHAPTTDDDGSLDIFVTNSETCNGPGCSVCGWTRCWHCCSAGQIPKCTGAPE